MSGSSLPGGSDFSARRRTRAVHMPAVPSSAAGVPAAAVPPSAASPAAAAGSTRTPRGNGSSSAAPKITTITAIRTRFATDTVKIDQCTKEPGWFMLIASGPAC